LAAIRLGLRSAAIAKSAMFSNRTVKLGCAIIKHGVAKLIYQNAAGELTRLLESTRLVAMSKALSRRFQRLNLNS
jgi:hypothetical protein